MPVALDRLVEVVAVWRLAVLVKHRCLHG